MSGWPSSMRGLWMEEVSEGELEGRGGEGGEDLRELPVVLKFVLQSC